MPDVDLSGCTPIPLASYLKALGVFRLVAEQRDPAARGWWSDDVFVLRSTLDRDALLRFLAEDYRPTPLVAPWGGRSGFYPGSSESTARAALDDIAATSLPRLAPFREIIALTKELLREHGYAEKVKDEQKLELLRICRANYPDWMLPWLDACYALTDDGRRFPPLLGTGGNEGSGSYVSGFAQQVVACLVAREHDAAIEPALFDVARPDAMSGQTPGQFSPEGAGGPNATSGSSWGGVKMNPWDFLLCLEGTLWFAASITRRHEQSGGGLSFPFTVRPAGSGSGAADPSDEANARAEMWLPLWSRPVAFAELHALLSEGRARFGSKPARNGLDFVRAAVGLGVDRGIDAFQRVAFLQRFGKNVFAIPLGRVAVHPNPAAEILTDLDHDGWLDSFRRLARSDDAPQRARSLIRRLEGAMFDFARYPERADRLAQRLLICLGEVQRYLAASPKMRERCAPVPELGQRWLDVARGKGSDDALAIAAALASLYAHRPEPAERDESEGMPMRCHLAPVSARTRRQWLQGASPTVVWSERGLEDNLIAVLNRRLIDASSGGYSDKPLAAAVTAPVASVSTWLAGEVDSRRIAELLPGLALLRFRRRVRIESPHVGHAPPLPAAYRLLKPLFCTDEQLRRAGMLPPVAPAADGGLGRGAGLSLPLELVRLLEIRSIDRALTLAWTRLRAAGFGKRPDRSSRPDAPAARSPSRSARTDMAALKAVSGAGIDGQRLLAALLVPIEDRELRALWDPFAPDEEPDARKETDAHDTEPVGAGE